MIRHDNRKLDLQGVRSRPGVTVVSFPPEIPVRPERCSHCEVSRFHLFFDQEVGGWKCIICGHCAYIPASMGYMNDNAAVSGTPPRLLENEITT